MDPPPPPPPPTFLQFLSCPEGRDAWWSHIARHLLPIDLSALRCTSSACRVAADSVTTSLSLPLDSPAALHRLGQVGVASRYPMLARLTLHMVGRLGEPI